MNGLSAEPGERARSRQIDLARRAPIIRAADIGEHVAASCSPPTTMASVGAVVEIAASCAARRSTAPCNGASSVVTNARSCWHATPAAAPDAARSAASPGARTARLRCIATAASAAVTTPSSTMRRSTLSRPAWRASGVAVGPLLHRRLRQRHQQRAFARVDSGSAPCRNRTSEAARTPSRLPPNGASVR